MLCTKMILSGINLIRRVYPVFYIFINIFCK
nr:MAG TPA: hypothetical protein [Caudoviricetes sp.]